MSRRVTVNTRSAWRRYPPTALPPIERAALACFVEQGYHGTSIRIVAARAGLSVPGLYHHYASKQDLLVAIVTAAMDDLWARSGQALDEAGEDPAERLDLLVECLVLFHAHRRDQAFIAASEIRSLFGPARTTLIAARDRQQRLVDTVVADGVADGRFAVAVDATEVSRALVTMCTGVAQWFRADGPRSAADLAHDYAAIARLAVGCRS